MTSQDPDEQIDALLRNSILSEPLDTTSLDARVHKRIAARKRVFLLTKLALAASLLVTGIAGYRTLFIATAPHMCADAARDHFREVTSREHRRWLTDATAIASLAQRAGLPEPVVAKLAPEGYHLERGKLCRLDGRVFLHLVYSNSTSEFSTYLTKPDARGFAGAVRETESGREHIAYFKTGHFAVLFVTDQSAAAALSFARSAARVL